MEIKLNEMSENDLDDVIEVSSLSLKETWSKEAFAQEITNPMAKYVVAEMDNKVIGFAGLWTIVDEGHITNIAVHPDYRGKGIGSKLVKSLIDNSKDWYINDLTLEVRYSNKIAQNLYKKYGFIEEGIRKNYYADNKEDAVIMWRRK